MPTLQQVALRVRGLLMGQRLRLRRLSWRVRRSLQDGNWQQALATLAERQTYAWLPATWEQRFRKLEADCHTLAGEQALAEQRYEDGVDHLTRAAYLFGLDAVPVRMRIHDAMLARLRQHFAERGEVQSLGDRVQHLFCPCAEALVWQGLAHARDGDMPAAIGKLRAAHAADAEALDPALYLGTLLLRQGEAAEALQALTIAHRIAPACPLVGWQLGVALSAVGSDGARAIRVLERTVDPEGLPRWLRQPQQLWTDGFADAGCSYVPRLAAVHPYSCPVFGNDVAAMLQQARFALAQSHYRQQEFAAAAADFTSILRDGPPSTPVLRGLGLALARLRRYDEAFTHLRTAHALEKSRDRQTAVYLALCAARGKPLRPEDKLNNLRWALGLLRQFDLSGDAELAEVAAIVVAEARSAGVAVPAQDLQRIGDCHQLLLQRSTKHEEAGQVDEALASAALLHLLAPNSTAALDRLAALHYRRGELEQSAAFLTEWEKLEPGHATPALRRAIVEQQRGQGAESAAAIDRALSVASGEARAQVALVGARLALTAAGAVSAEQAFALSTQPADLERGEMLLAECVRCAPANTEALWCLAALKALRQRPTELAALAPVMRNADSADPRFHYLAAACHLAAEIPVNAMEATRRTASDPLLDAESAYLRARAFLMLDKTGEAVEELRQSLARSPSVPSADYARALLAQISFATAAYSEAIRWWRELPEERRVSWKLQLALQQTQLCAGVAALRAGKFDEAIDRLEEVRSLGGSGADLANMARFCAAQQAPAERAAELLERLVEDNVGGAGVRYRLAMVYKQLGRLPEAQTILESLTPDADVSLQLGVLALRHRDVERAEREFANAWTVDRARWAAGYNLLLCRLALGRMEGAANLAADVAEHVGEDGTRRFLTAIQALLLAIQPENGAANPEAVLGRLSDDDEKCLVQVLGNLGHLDSADLLLRALQRARPLSDRVREAAFEALLARAWRMVTRGRWADARRLVAPRTGGPVSKRLLPAALNLLGLTECMMQDFEDGRQSFTAALHLAADDARVYQNLALTYEWLGQPELAASQWDRYFEGIDCRLPTPAGVPDYLARLRGAGLSRLAARCIERRDWAEARIYLERAHRAWPEDVAVLERLFQLYQQAQRFEDGQRILDQLRQLRPDDPRYELYALELVEFHNPDDVERVLTEIERLGQKYAGDQGVEARVASVVAQTIEALEVLHKRQSAQLHRAGVRLRRLPEHMIDWDEVEDFARFTHGRLLKLKKAADRCVPIAGGEAAKQRLRALSQQLARQASQCRRLVP